MSYSIGDVASMCGLPIYTLRYYDKEGLLPHITRNQSGIRRFEQADLDTIRVIECLKLSGMQIKDIKQFMEWCQQGDGTLQERLDMFRRQEQDILGQIARLNKALDLIRYKQWYYSTAVQAGTEGAVKGIPLENMPSEIQALFQSSH